MRPSVDEDGTTHRDDGPRRARTEDIDEFMEKLEATGAFEQVLQRQDEDRGRMLRAIIETDYVPEAAEPGDAEPDPKAAKPSHAAGPKKTAASPAAACAADCRRPPMTLTRRILARSAATSGR